MKKQTLINLFILFFLFSCQSYELENIEINDTPIENNPYKVSIDEAKDIALNFMKTFQKTPAASTRSAGISIENVEVVKVNKAATRSAGIENGMDTLLYAVNFSNNNGYILVGADRRTDPIFGIIDNGSFSDESITTNPNFAFFLDLALGKAVYDILKNDTVKIVNTRSINDYDDVYGTAYNLSSKWGQGAPYNQYCPGPYTGCVATATAQILSFFPTIGSVNWQNGSSYGSSVLHWKQIATDCFRYKGILNTVTTPQSANEVAHLMRYLGVALKAEYKSDGTSIESKNAINWLNDYASLKASGLKKYDADQVFMAANRFSDKIVYMRGNRGKKSFVGITITYTGGHAWIADGSFTATRNSDGQRVNLFHFNWGWDGRSNGYFPAAVFDSSNPAINDSELPGILSLDNDGTSGNNYKYNVDYSIVENPNRPESGGTIK